MPKKILVTGASGNVGRAVFHELIRLGHEAIPVGRDEAHLRKALYGWMGAACILDFECDSPIPDLGPIDGAFIMRPPQIGKITKAFAELLHQLAKRGINQNVFLSVQGAESRAYLPHAKIEKFISEIGLPCAFIRPGYFMENLITTLRHQVVEQRCLAMPSGSAPFNWIAVSDIAACAARLLADGFVETHPGYTLSGNETLTMDEVALRLQNVLGFPFSCRHPNVLRYAFREWRRTKSMTFVGVMLLLHWLPKFGPKPARSDDLQKLLGRPGMSLDTWISDNRSEWDKRA